ncbi:MAG TPA: response regulator [Oligoflexia bacterium]|nr:response regulator [Oligoflexia bacterium]HMR24391.1 response regulator [Oligoflexia bacterium]
MENIKAKILLVDDDDFFLEYMHSRLSDEGFDVQVALSVDTALEMLESDDFDLCVTDFKMPVKTGEDLLRSLRIDTKLGLKDLPVIVLSWISDQDIRKRLDSYGPSAFLEKMLRPHQIAKIIDNILQERRSYSLH